MKFDRQRFVNDIRELAKREVMFRHLGRDPETGIDCIHLPAWGYRKQGLELPFEIQREMESYSESPDGWRMIGIMRKWFMEIKPELAAPGDLLILFARRNPKHLAVKVTNDNPPLVVEAYRSEDRKIGKLIEQPLDWRRRICTAFRIPDFAPQP